MWGGGDRGRRQGSLDGVVVDRQAVPVSQEERHFLLLCGLVGKTGKRCSLGSDLLAHLLWTVRPAFLRPSDTACLTPPVAQLPSSRMQERRARAGGENAIWG